MNIDPALIYGFLMPVVLGLAFTIVSYFKNKEVKKLKQSGIKVTGDVVAVEYEPPANYSPADVDDYNNQTGSYFPVIRYPVGKNEYVSKRSEIGRYPNKYNEGDTVPVIYDPDNVNEFIIDDNSSKIFVVMFWSGIFLVAVGIVVFIIKMVA